MRLAVFADASFACNSDLKSQLGFVVTQMDAQNCAKIVHNLSFQSKRTTRSVLATELLAAVHAFDYTSTVRLVVNDIMGKNIPLVIYTDSKSIFEGLAGIITTTEKPLLMDLKMHGVAYEVKEVAEVVWIPSAQIRFDKMRKGNASPALKKLKDDNAVDIEPMSWVARRDFDAKGDNE